MSANRAVHCRRHLLGGAALALLVGGLFCLGRTSPRPAAVCLAGLAVSFAYLAGYSFERRSRRRSQRRARGAASATAALLAACLLAATATSVAHGAATFSVPVLVACVASQVAGQLQGRRRRLRPKRPTRESALAHQYLDGLRGVEIGGSLHNPFGLNTWNLDYTASTDTVYKQAELEALGSALPVDIVARGDALPFADGSLDFVLSSHVLEHFPDPIGALQEWYRVIRPRGYLFMIVPHKERTFDRDRPRTTLAELIRRHETGEATARDGHYSVWVTEDLLELLNYLGFPTIAVQDPDDKAGNGFAVVVRKP